MTLTSLDYAKLIAWIAFNKHHVTLNKTQVQKILFICYGWYLVAKDAPLFSDDPPKAWPFGPVFPRSYKRYDKFIDSDLTMEEKAAFMQDKDTLRQISIFTGRYCHMTARDLTAWSHQPDTPWSKTVFKGDGKIHWSEPIDIDDIKQYFKEGRWKIGLC